MLASTLNITYNAATVTLNKVNWDNYTSTYYAESGGNRFTLDIKHTVPPKGQTGESHLVKLSVEYYDGSGIYLGTETAWTVMKSFDRSQNSTDALRVANALVALTTSAFNTSLLARDS